MNRSVSFPQHAEADRATIYTKGLQISLKHLKPGKYPIKKKVWSRVGVALAAIAPRAIQQGRGKGLCGIWNGAGASRHARCIGITALRSERHQGPGDAWKGGRRLQKWRQVT